MSAPTPTSATSPSVPAGAAAAPLVCLAAAGPFFVLYPAVRPYGDASESTAAAAFASAGWLVAHLAAVVGFVLVGFGLYGLRRVAGGAATRAAGLVPVLWAVGAGLVLPYYGAEMFALHAVGQQVLATGDSGMLVLVDQIRFGALQMTLFGAGLVLLAIVGGTVVAAVPRDRRLAALPFAVGMVAFLPQFYGSPALRIAHGVVLGTGCVLLAVAAARGLPRRSAR